MMSGGGSDISEGLSQLFGGLFGNSGKPYQDAGKVLEDYLRRGRDTQNPFMKAGTDAIPQFQEWLNGMKDPSGFINTLMGKYQESPWAKYQQDQSLRAAGNAGSESGLNGSTPMAQFEQQNARNISSQDMNQWLQNVLGINTQYGAGQQGMINTGQHAADQLTGLYKDFGQDIAASKYGSTAANQRDKNDIWGGWFKTGEGVGKAFGGMF